jgi:hypothetical protein
MGFRCGRLPAVDHSGFSLVVNHQLLGGIDCLLACLGDDCCDRLADVPDAGARERPTRGLCHCAAVVRPDRPQRPHRSDLVRVHVGAGEDGDDTG